jgi:cytochrome c oxidase cbb3-type subunit 3
MAMPRFGLDGVLEPAAIADVAQYVRSLSGPEGIDAAAAERGKVTFAEQCSACHGEDGKGNQAMGAPNLTDSIWLYGNSQEAVTQSVTTGRGGAMPAWSTRLDPETVKMLAVYIHSLGGGK